MVKGAKNETVEGVVIVPKDIKAIDNEFKKKLKSLKKEYSKTKKVAKDGNSNKSNGFQNPMYVDKCLSLLFQESNLGPAYKKIEIPGEEGVPPTYRFEQVDTKLNNHLNLFFQHQITSSALLTPLFSIYAKQFKIQLEKK